MAQTGYERIYCQVISQGEGAGLPPLEDFRRNDARIQALLLKRPAERLGIALPKPAAASPKPESAPGRSATKPLQATEPAPGNPSGRGTGTSSGPVVGLRDCRLRSDVIDCPGGRYELVGNQSNKDLAPGALGEANKLGLRPYRGDRQDEAAVRRYLSAAYDRYIPKMLEIGLGGATMSFTAFYHGFYRHEEQGVDFAERMESIYHYLKQDKRNNAVKARFHERLPQSIKACTGLSAALIVCDDVETNWVYRRIP